MPDQTRTSCPGVSFRSRLTLLLTVLPAVFLIDYLSKSVVQHTMTPYGETIPLVDDLFKLRFIYNEGIAFGLRLGISSQWVLALVSSAVAVILIGYILFSRYGDRAGLFALSLVAGGAFGNLYDRLVYGRVVDFFEIGYRDLTWPVFNVADIAVTAGAILLAVRLMFDGRMEPDADEEDKVRGGKTGR
jgi:signal peptidase II